MLNITTLRLQSILGLAFLAVLAAFTGLFMTGANYDWQGMLLVVTGIGILAVFLLPLLARGESKNFIKILIIGLLLKLVFAMLNYYIAFIVYKGSADVVGYHQNGVLISHYIWNLDFNKVAPFLKWGTDFIPFFTGIIYAVIGPTIFGGYLVYAFLSFLGSYYFYRAFRIAFPNGNKWLFALLIFFFPSILYWPSTIGKDALMSLSLGLFAYGSAQIIQNRIRGLIPLALGFTGALWVRPHIAAISMFAFALSFFLPGVRKKSFNPATYTIGLLAVGGLAWYLLPKVLVYLNLEKISPTEIISYIKNYQALSSQGGSAFQAINLNSPLDYLISPITVLLRPFPWEAHNLLALFESLMGVSILLLLFWRIKSLGRAIASSISNVYLRYVLIYLIIFFVIFAAITNFGTLVRERVMMFPFFFMLLSYSPLRSKESRSNQPEVSMQTVIMSSTH
jgi:hypothetical protein